MNFEIIESGSGGNCYLVRHNNNQILIDPGIGFDKIAKYLKYDFSNLSCLISHSHSDHCKAVKDLIKRGIKCYCRKETKEELKVKSHNIIEIALDKVFYTSPISKSYLMREDALPAFEITAFDLFHSIPNCGFFVKGNPNCGFFDKAFPEQDRLVYAIDCQQIPYRFAAEHICIECNYDKLLLGPMLRNTNIWHMEIEDCKKFLAGSVDRFTKEIVLLHVSQRHGDKEKFVNEMQEIYKNINVRAN